MLLWKELQVIILWSLSLAWDDYQSFKQLYAFICNIQLHYNQSFVFQYCDVADVAIIHKMIQPDLATD